MNVADVSETSKTRRLRVFFFSSWVSLSCMTCSGTPSPDAGPAAWHVVLSNLQGMLLCVWGTSPHDVFAVGGALGNGTPSVVLHYDGSTWRNLGPGGTDTLWWAHGTGCAAS